MGEGSAGIASGSRKPACIRSPYLRAGVRAACLLGCVSFLDACTFGGSRNLPSDPSLTAAPEDLAEPPEQGTDALSALYADVEGQLTSTGRMRRDVAPIDAPYSVDDLVRNFERIALYDEYVDVDGRFLQSETPAYLRRWEQPVRVAVMTGPSVLPEEAARDRANVAAFTNRLSRLTGVDMALANGPDVNFLVLFMNNSEQQAFGREVAARFPSFSPAVTSAIAETQLDTFCTAYAFSNPDQPALYAAVLILIRAEHPPLTKLSCVHEEMAQAMGLPNDSPDARPSLFNDSLEFALLTEHDEILLRMLYDPRLEPGMTAEEARPLLPAVAQDAMQEERAAQTAGSS
ncbi:DUF2927 domain-containing protein [Amaricoccus macauensis]|uniref:DUF2927 domain-containing protein n=1 Tax=Amaricoccus macauensis TaxID=57001 RepID=UPI003C7D963D